MYQPLTPMSAEDAFYESCDYFLGTNFYVVDSLGPTQVKANIVDEIKKKYPKKQTKEKTKKRKKIRSCLSKGENYGCCERMRYLWEVV